MKQFARKWLGAELEVPIVEGRRADALFTTPNGNPCVIECQASPISITEIVHRTRDYRLAGYPVMWWFHASRLNWHRGEKDEAAVPAEIRDLGERQQSVLIFVDDAHSWPDEDWPVLEAPALFDVVLATANERYNEWEGEYLDTPTTFRRPCVHQQVLPFDPGPGGMQLYELQFKHTGGGRATMQWARVSDSPEAALVRRLFADEAA